MALEFKGTKGEWVRVGDIYPTIECKIKDVGGLPTIAVVNSTFRDEEESKANAKLIASAPQLLKEHQTDLIVLTNWIERFDSVFGVGSEMQQELQDMINAKEEAIKKALL